MREQGFAGRLREARELSWRLFGRRITFYVPGMFSMNGFSGRYLALSITADRCALKCDHCRGRILSSMIPAATPETLLRECLRLASGGIRGVLISGGCDSAGRIPWDRFAPAIREVKDRTGLFVSVHSGLVDEGAALTLREAGADQALMDVAGDEETYRDICHLDSGLSRTASSLEALRKAGLPVVPHIVCGLHFGKIRAEDRALELIRPFAPEHVVICSLMRFFGTPARGWPAPDAEAVAGLIAGARLALPSAVLGLGCARQRGDRRMEILAVDAGVNRMALPSEEAVERARQWGLEVRYQDTCCSLPGEFSTGEVRDGSAWEHPGEPT